MKVKDFHAKILLNLTKVLPFLNFTKIEGIFHVENDFFSKFRKVSNDFNVHHAYSAYTYKLKRLSYKAII